MGIIYKLTSPSGKSYIGQTVYTLEKRFKQHVKTANGGRVDGCMALNNAIRKYGGENFIKKEMCSCDIDLLDFWEEFYIADEKTFYPNGYNLTTGGASPRQISEISLKKKSQNRREYYKDEDLPVYIQHIKNARGHEGYIVEKPGKKSGQFCRPDQTMEEKKKLAIEYLKDIDSIRDSGWNHRQLPKYVYEINSNDRHGYRVARPGFKDFVIQDSSKTMEEKKVLALEYLEKINKENPPQKKQKPAKEDGLPMYVSKINKADYCGEGYQVHVPGAPSRKFTSAKESMESKKEKAIAYAKEKTQNQS